MLKQVVYSTHICKRFASTAVKDARTKALIDKIIRVDHAGELGADRIYAGQYAVLGKTPVGPLIKVIPTLLNMDTARFMMHSLQVFFHCTSCDITQ